MKCPICDNELVPVLYGLIRDPEIFKKLEKKEIFLAGCNYQGNGEKEYHCFKCNKNYLESEIKRSK